MSQRQSNPRSGLIYAALAGLTILIGLVVHSSMIPLGPGLRKYAGDALWAAVAFFLMSILFARASTRVVAVSAFGFSAMVEFSQLYHAPWIDSVRKTSLGTLVLGYTFNWPDFVAYAVGIGLAILVDRRLSPKRADL